MRDAFDELSGGLEAFGSCREARVRAARARRLGFETSDDALGASGIRIDLWRWPSGN